MTKFSSFFAVAVLAFTGSVFAQPITCATQDLPCQKKQIALFKTVAGIYTGTLTARDGTVYQATTEIFLTYPPAPNPRGFLVLVPSLSATVYITVAGDLHDTEVYSDGNFDPETNIFRASKSSTNYISLTQTQADGATGMNGGLYLSGELQGTLHLSMSN